MVASLSSSASRVRQAPPRQTHSTYGWQGMRVRLKGINSKRKRLANGRIRTYWYAWKGGPPLRGEHGTPEFIASYYEAVAAKVAPPTGVLLSLLQGYQASSDFLERAERTWQDYIRQIKIIETEF